jgi:hypothetical protein
MSRQNFNPPAELPDYPSLEERKETVRALTLLQHPSLRPNGSGTCDDCGRDALVRFVVGRFTVCRRCAGLRDDARAKAAA